MQAARDLIKSKRYSEALAKLRSGCRTEPHRQRKVLIEQMRASAALSAGDNGQAIKAIQALLASGRLSESQQAQYAGSLASLYYREKDYREAAQWAGKALRSNPSDGAMRSLQISSYYQAGDLGASREALEDVQAAEKPAGYRLRIAFSCWPTSPQRRVTAPRMWRASSAWSPTTRRRSTGSIYCVGLNRSQVSPTA